MGIILGLSAAFFWGTADFLVRYTTRIIGTYRTLFYMQFIGLAGLSIFLVTSGEFSRLAARISWQWWILAVITALLNVISALALYRSFEIGVLAIVSPICCKFYRVDCSTGYTQWRNDQPCAWIRYHRGINRRSARSHTFYSLIEYKRAR